MTPELDSLLEESNRRVAVMTPAQLAEMRQQQTESFARAMAPAGAGMTREQIERRIDEIVEDIRGRPWGAALSEMIEEHRDLERRLAAMPRAARNNHHLGEPS